MLLYFGMLHYEDAWPLKGNFDFNDQTLACNHLFTLNPDNSVAQMQVTYNLLAAGANFHNGLCLELPLTWAAAESISLVTTEATGFSSCDSEFDKDSFVTSPSAVGTEEAQQSIARLCYASPRKGPPLGLCGLRRLPARRQGRPGL